MQKEPAGARLQKKDFIAMLSVAMAAGSVFFPGSMLAWLIPNQEPQPFSPTAYIAAPLSRVAGWACPLPFFASC